MRSRSRQGARSPVIGTAADVFRRVFDEPGFAVSNSGMEVGYAALGLALCGDVASLEKLRGRSMPFNGIDQTSRSRGRSLQEIGLQWLSRTTSLIVVARSACLFSPCRDRSCCRPSASESAPSSCTASSSRR